jgi:3-hydroxyacyl-[acyl-carrier-protein] dehydratase
MNALRSEIKKCMSVITQQEDGRITAKFSFPPSFLGFKGHFDGNPVLPGVCKIQAVLIMLEAWESKTIELKEIVLAKFYAPVSCGQELVFRIQKIPGESFDALIKASVTKSGERVAELKLKIIYKDKL